MEVLLEWEGRRVLVVPFLEPGISLEPLTGVLRLGHPKKGLVRLQMDEMAIALPKATFIEAGWVAGHDETALSIVQGGARVDVFLDDEPDDPRHG